MADKVTIDFENEIITWDTDNQKGTESCPGISKRKNDILTAMGYESVDFSPVVNSFNAFINGQITKDELIKLSEKFLKD